MSKATAIYTHETVEELEAMWRENGHGLSEAYLSQTRVRLDQLYEAPQAFQPRHLMEEWWAKKKHLRTLQETEAAKAGRLDHIEVWPVAGKRIVIDGHMRLMAYREVGLDGSTKVPVRHVQGSLWEALERASEANSKDKLPWTKADKWEAAWRMVKLRKDPKDPTDRHIARLNNVSPATVGTMRKTLAEYPSARDLSWRSTKRELQKRRDPDQAAMEKRVDTLANRLRRTFGKIPVKEAETWKQAFEKAYPELAEDQNEAQPPRPPTAPDQMRREARAQKKLAQEVKASRVPDDDF